MGEGTVKAREVWKFITEAESLSLSLCKPNAGKEGDLKELRVSSATEGE